jgi:hypothetical protein
MENQNICQKFISEIDVFDRVYQKTNGIVTILQGDIREVGFGIRIAFSASLKFVNMML